MDRILIWRTEDLPRYYMEKDYEPVALRIMSRENPGIDVEVDIFSNGATIFNEAAILPGDETFQDLSVDFVDDPIMEEGSIITCSIANGNDITVQLELQSADDA